MSVNGKENQATSGCGTNIKTMRSTSEGGESTCPVCHDPILMFAIGPCDHPICHRCSTRMRVLIEKNDCPICRSTTPQVAFVYHKQLFKDINLRNCIPNRKYKIFFEDEEVEDSYLELLEYRCRLCQNRKPEKTFALLQTHLRREHQMFACDLCVTFLKIFPYERKFYNRKNLATHRRIGDNDDKSYKGHPLCEFCDTRYFDKDELMKHLRKDHYFCHFCDQQGSNAYYDQYPDLLSHFSDSHYLCTEGECGNPTTQFTHAFATEIDLKAHKASVHNKKSREARTLEVDFQLPPRRQGINRGSDNYSDSRSHGPRGGDRYHRRRELNDAIEDAELHRALQASLALQNSEEGRPAVAERVPDPVHDFPSLNGAAVSIATPASQQHAKSPEEDFPSLSSARTGNDVGRKKAPASSGMAYSSVMNPPPVSRPQPVAVRNESKPVSLGVVSSSSSRTVPGRPAPSNSEEDYPSLGGGSKPVSASSQASWLLKSNSTSNKTTSASSKAASKNLAISKVPTKRNLPVSAPFRKPISDESEFPSLGSKDRGIAFGSLSSSLGGWSSSQNSGSKKSSNVTPRSERVDDDTFELPDAYYTSFKDPTESSNINIVEKPPEPIVKVASKQAPVSTSSKDFPGLPTREKKLPEPPAKDKKKKKNNKKARDKENTTERKNFDDSNASLNEIAQALMQPEGKMKGTKAVSNGVRAEKPTDWFDSPPKEFTEKTTPLQQQDKEQSKINSPRPKLNLSAEPFREMDKNGLSSNGLASGSKEENSIDTDNFPSLHTMSASIQLEPHQKLSHPPGFSKSDKHGIPKKQISAPSKPPVPTPPPGFVSSTSAVFSDLKAISASLSSMPAPPPGFNKGHTSSAPPMTPAVYIEPPEFKKRNSKLISDIRKALETVGSGFDNFRTLSMHFRQGFMEASDYYTDIRTLLGADDFSNLFPELLALLPDIMKQRQLFEVHQAASGRNKILGQCQVCSQVTLSRDLQHHRFQHGADAGATGNDDFPSLGGEDGVKRPSSASGMLTNGAWIKAK